MSDKEKEKQETSDQEKTVNDDIEKETNSDTQTEANAETEEDAGQADSDNQLDSSNDDTADKIKQLEQDLADKNEQVLRLSAEIKNIQHRQKQEKEDLQKYRSQDLAKEILPAMDSLEKALEIEVDDEASASLKKGIEMVRDNLIHALKSEGVEVVDPKGEKFDPKCHQSVSSVPSDDDHPADTVVEVYQKGYILRGDRVLRPAMVVVAQ